MKDYHINIFHSQEDNACIADIPDVDLIQLNHRAEDDQKSDTKPEAGKCLSLVNASKSPSRRITANDN